MSNQPLMGSDNEKLTPEGLPDIPVAERDASEASARKTVAGFTVVASAVGLGIGAAIYYVGGKAAADEKIAAVTKEDLAWAYLAAWFFARTVQFANFYPVIAKARVMRAKSGNLRANMYVFKSSGENAVPGVVVMAAEGDVGKYNRANRSLHHLTVRALPVPGDGPTPVLKSPLPSARVALAAGEHGARAHDHVSRGAMLPVGGFCTSRRPVCVPWPRRMLAEVLSAARPYLFQVCILVWCVGRIMHQIGYSNGGYGAHGQGFMLASLATEALNGMVLFVGLKSLGVVP